MISFIVPVVRPEKAKRCIEAIHNAASGSAFAYEVLSEVDEGGIGCPNMVKMLVEKSKGEFICFLGDDSIIDRDAIINAMECFEDDSILLVGFNDGRNEDFATHWIAREGLRVHLENKELFYTGYYHCFCDMELWDRATEVGKAVICESAKLEHDHPSFKDGRGVDKWYEKIYEQGHYAEDQKLYWSRKRSRVVKNMGFYPAICEPNVREYLPSDFHRSMVVLDRPTTPWVYLTPTEAVTDFPTDWSRIRNNLCVQSLNHGCTHTIMLDTDQIYPRNTYQKLISNEKWKDPQTAVVAGLVHKRWKPFDPALRLGEPGEYRLPKEKLILEDGTIEVDAVGTACIMISNAALLSMTSIYPWFKEVMLDDGEIVSEDINFCYKLKCVGYRIYVDTSIDVTHLLQVGVNKKNAHLVRNLFGINLYDEEGAMPDRNKFI